MGEQMLEVLARKQEGEILEGKDISSLIFTSFRSDIGLIMFQVTLTALSQVVFSFLFYFLLQSVQQKQVTKAYLYSIVLSAVLALRWCFLHIRLHNGTLMNFKIKAGLLMLLQQKISSLTSLVI